MAVDEERGIGQGLAMSDEKRVEIIRVVDELKKTHTETAASETPPVAPLPPETKTDDSSKWGEKANPIALLLFMIFALVIILVITSIRRSDLARGEIRMDDPVVAGLKADLEARRAELNRQRMAAGLPPLEGASEPIDEIARRLKSDSDTLVGLAGRFQQMLTEKDAALSARDAEILRSGKLRQDMAAEISRLRSELQGTLAGGSDSDDLRRQLENLQAQRDALSSELAAAREQLAQASGSVSPQDYADLERRFGESEQAKEFFENRVKELEASPEAEIGPDEEETR